MLQPFYDAVSHEGHFMAEKTQSFQNHRRNDPAFHQFLAPVALILLIGGIVNIVRNFGWSSGWHLLLAMWVFVATFKIRLYALKVQDRVIRLEERLRLQRVLSEPLRARIGELSERQLVGLRFASDEELHGLVEKTLAGKLEEKQIKQAVQNWRPDFWRV
jgi:hypothetical protein